MMRIARGLTITTGLLALLALGAPALASVVAETEADFTVVNNTPGTAQAVPTSAFTTPVPATVFNPPGFATATITGAGSGDDVDFYSFTATGGVVLLDIDDDPLTFDPMLALFNSAGTLLAFDDDSSPADPGSENEVDSFLGTFTLPGPGLYFVAVSEFLNFPTALDCASTSALTRPDGGLGGASLTGCTPGDATFQSSGFQQQGNDYTLHISLSSPGPAAAVPLPATLALVGCAVAGVGLVSAWSKNRPSRTENPKVGGPIPSGRTI